MEKTLEERIEELLREAAQAFTVEEIAAHLRVDKQAAAAALEVLLMRRVACPMGGWWYLFDAPVDEVSMEGLSGLAARVSG